MRAAAAKIEIEHHLAGLGGRLQRDQSHSVVADLVTRPAAQPAGQRLALDGIGLVLRQVRCGDLKLAARAAPHRLALLVQHTHGNHRRGAAIGHQL